jgi:hypothetical protein
VFKINLTACILFLYFTVIIGKQPSLSHGLPYKILPHCIRVSLVLISQQISFSEQGHLSCTSSLEDQVPAFMSTSDKVAQLYCQGTRFFLRPLQFAGLLWSCFSLPPRWDYILLESMA